MFRNQQTFVFRAFAAVASIGCVAFAAPASAVPVATVTYSANGLPAIGGSVNGIDLTGRVGQTQFTLNTGANAVTVKTNGGAIVQGSLSNAYAAPVTGANGATYAAPYFSTGGTPNTISLNFASAQSYLGFLWGSIGSGDYLAFFDNGGTEIYRLTGATAQATAPSYDPTGGAQGYNGSEYTLINFFGGQFSSVVLGQTVAPSFESAGFEYAAVNVNAVPEPSSLALAGVALLGCVALRRKA